MKKNNIREEQYKQVFTEDGQLKDASKAINQQRHEVADVKLGETKELCRSFIQKAFKLGMKYKSVGLADFKNGR